MAEKKNLWVRISKIFSLVFHWRGEKSRRIGVLFTHSKVGSRVHFRVDYVDVLTKKQLFTN